MVNWLIGVILGRVDVEEKKVSAMSEWPQPTLVKYLQRFLGFTNFYCQFVRSFSTVAAPLTNLLKGITKSFKPEVAHEFQKLKELFVTALKTT